jgi:hypothetical protein
MNFLQSADFYKTVLRADQILFEQDETLTRRRQQIGAKTLSLIQQTQNKSRDLDPSSVNTSAISALENIYGKHIFERNFGIGITEFRGVGYLLHLPNVIGTVKIDCFSCSTLQDSQKHIVHENSLMRARFQGHFRHAMQFHLGVQSHAQQSALTQRLFRESKRNFRAGCYIIAQSEDFLDAYHSMFLAVEMGIKGFLSKHGWEEKKLEELRHNHTKLCDEIIDYIRPEKRDDVEQSLNNFPHLINTRYGKETVSSQDALKACLDAQFILGEVSRSISEMIFVDD